jgi:hypothetical protein
MGKYRKKPVVIEAVQVLPENDAALLEFFHTTAAPFEVVGPWTFVLHTLEGDMTASPGDWLIRGIQGEVYPCKPDIFERTYEAVIE